MEQLQKRSWCSDEARIVHRLTSSFSFLCFSKTASALHSPSSGSGLEKWGTLKSGSDRRDSKGGLAKRLTSYLTTAPFDQTLHLFHPTKLPLLHRPHLTNIANTRLIRHHTHALAAPFEHALIAHPSHLTWFTSGAQNLQPNTAHLPTEYAALHYPIRPTIVA